MYLFFTLRIVTVIISWLYPGNILLTIIVMSIQFLIMPFSFFVSVTQFIALFPPMFIGHLFLFYPLRYIVSLLPTWLQYGFHVNNTFIFLFFMIDQLICFGLLFYLPGHGKTATISNKRILWSIGYSFLNAKSFYLILLPHMDGLYINLTVFFIDWLFGLCEKFNTFFSAKTLHWATLFYTQHRMSHIPFVYEHAHKFHHFLHDSTAFDGHLYGSGAPEEYHILCMELILTVVFGWTPVSLSPWVLYLSWTNKVGHARKEIEKDGYNAHVDHHTLHRKNFGIYYMCVDMAFGTASNNDNYFLPGFKVAKTVENGKIIFQFDPNDVEVEKETKKD